MKARALFDVNFFGHLALAQLATPYLRQSRGTLVNVSSIAGKSTCRGSPSTREQVRARGDHLERKRTELEARRRPCNGCFPRLCRNGFPGRTRPGPGRPIAWVQGRRFAISARECAEAIVDGIAHRKRMWSRPVPDGCWVWANRFSRASSSAHGTRLGNG